MEFLSDPLCCRCGYPFPFYDDTFSSLQCGACLKAPPVYDQARSCFQYQNLAKDLILKFKHGDAHYVLPFFRQCLIQTYLKNGWSADIVVPVPLHWTRLWKRKFNQAAVLAQSLGHSLQIPQTPDILRRIKRTLPQGSTRKQRLENVKGAFKVASPARIQGKTVLLVDDVITSGATVQSCAKALKACHPKKIIVLTLAYVPKT